MPPIKEILLNLLSPDGPAEIPGNPPCIGCGWCCCSGPCIVALVFYPMRWWIDAYRRSKHGLPCPSLRWDTRLGRHTCGLYPIRYILKCGGLIADKSCIMPCNPWRFEPVHDRTTQA